MKIFTDLKNDFSVFKNEKVNLHQIQNLLTESQSIETAFNENSSQFIIADKILNEDLFNKMVNCLAEQDQPLAKSASVLIINLARKNFLKTGKPNNYSFYNNALVIADFQKKSAEIGITVRPIFNFSRFMVLKRFKLPVSVDVVNFLAVGILENQTQIEKDINLN